MPRQYNATGIDLSNQSFEPLPDGKYILKITKAEEAESKNGNLMARLECEVINNADHNGRKVFHNVTFLEPDAKGAGMAIHFLKTIGQPWEGQIEIDIPNWVGARFLGTLAKASYTSTKTGQLVHKNEIKKVEPDPDWIPF
jgi:hypothetical protein